MEDLRYLEIEHKYIVDSQYDETAFFDQVRLLGPTRFFQVEVEDTYFVCESVPGHVYRHRKDHLVEELTVKGIGQDAETRMEVNLDLFKKGSNQIDSVKAFLKPLGISWAGMISKKVWVFDFDDCEIVLYDACHKNKSVRCIEVESKNYASIDEAKKILEKYGRLLKLPLERRSKESLFHLLLEPSIGIS